MQGLTPAWPEANLLADDQLAARVGNADFYGGATIEFTTDRHLLPWESLRPDHQGVTSKDVATSVWGAGDLG